MRGRVYSPPYIKENAWNCCGAFSTCFWLKKEAIETLPPYFLHIYWGLWSFVVCFLGYADCECCSSSFFAFEGYFAV